MLFNIYEWSDSKNDPLLKKVNDLSFEKQCELRDLILEYKSLVDKYIENTPFNNITNKKYDIAEVIGINKNEIKSEDIFELFQRI